MKRGPKRRNVALSAEAYSRAHLAITTVHPDNWHRLARCRDSEYPSDLWFCDQETAAVRSGMEATAKRVCASCPVRQPCLAYALSHREPFGIWSGFDPDEIDRLRRTLHVSAIDMPTTILAVVDTAQEVPA